MQRPKFKPWLPSDAGDPQGQADEEEGEGDGDGLDALLDQYEAEAAAQAQQVLQQQARKGKASSSVAQQRDEALAAPIPADNKGFKLLQKMGYQPGQGLGKSVVGRTEPLKPEVRLKRSGLGVHEDRKRQRSEEAVARQLAAAAQAEARRASCAQFQDTGREAYLRRRALGQLAGAWRVCEQLESGAAARHATERRLPGGVDVPGLLPPSEVPGVFGGMQLPPPSQRTVELMQQLPALWVAAGNDDEGSEAALGDPDEEQGSPPALALDEQLQTLLQFLRQQHLYCLFCGCTYSDIADLQQNCPGDTEEDH